MKNIEKILKKKRLCQALTGVSPEKIYESLPYFEIELEKHDKKEKKSSKGRKTELANSLEKLFFTHSIFPNKYPAKQIPTTHKNAPTTLYVRNVLYDILPIPATKGAKVLTIGTKRAITIVFEPYFS